MRVRCAWVGIRGLSDEGGVQLPHSRCAQNNQTHYLDTRIIDQRRTLDSTVLTMTATNTKKPLPSLESRAVTPPTTPTPVSASAHQLLSHIRCIYQELSGLTNLEPCEHINSLLTRLVNLCITPYSQEFSDCFFNIDGADALCHSLRPLCANAEGELERYWANRILYASTNIQGTQQ